MSEINGNYIMGKKDLIKDQIVNAVREHDRDIEPSLLLERVSCDSQMTLYKYLDQLVEDGKLRETRDVCHTTMYDVNDSDNED